jgi:hypothetical protein
MGRGKTGNINSNCADRLPDSFLWKAASLHSFAAMLRLYIRFNAERMQFHNVDALALRQVVFNHNIAPASIVLSY